MLLNTVAINYLFNQLKIFSLSFVKKDKETELTPHQEAVLKTLKGWGDRENAVVRFASAIMQFDFAPYMKRASDSFKVGMIVVPLRNYGSHNYNLNEPVWVKTESQAFRLKDGMGNNLHEGFSDPENIRLATVEEIEFFYSELSKASEEVISDFINNSIKNVEISVKK